MTDTPPWKTSGPDEATAAALAVPALLAVPGGGLHEVIRGAYRRR